MDYDTYQQDKQLIGKFRAALYDCDASALRGQLREVLAPDCIVRVSTPFEEMDGPDGLFEQGYRPLLNAIPDLERRDFIVIAGLSEAEALGGLRRPLHGRVRAAVARHPADPTTGGDALPRVLPRGRKPGGRDARGLGHPPTDDAGARLADGAQFGRRVARARARNAGRHRRAALRPGQDGSQRDPGARHAHRHGETPAAAAAPRSCSWSATGIPR